VVVTFFVGPFSRKGRKALTSRPAPVTLGSNYRRASSARASRKANKDGLTISLNSSIRTPSLPMPTKVKSNRYVGHELRAVHQADRPSPLLLLGALAASSMRTPKEPSVIFSISLVAGYGRGIQKPRCKEHLY